MRKKDVLTTGQVAQLCNVAPRTVTKWFDSRLPLSDACKIILLGSCRIYTMWRNGKIDKKAFSPNYFSGNISEIKKLDDRYFNTLVFPKIVEIEEEIEIDLDVEMTEETVIEEVVFEEAPEEEEADEIFSIVEDQPAPSGGLPAFYKYVQSKLKYPAQARRMGIEGKVFVQFVVDKDGTLTEVQAVKGIGAGCDEEAVRVIKGAPKWKPGKQRGRAVKVRMILPITFKLG